MPVEKLELEVTIDDRGAISTVKRFGKAVEEAMAPGPVDRQARAFQALMDRLEPARAASERYRREHQMLVNAYVSGQIPMDRMRAATRALTAEQHQASAATTSWTSSLGKWALGIAAGYLSFQGLMMAVRQFAGFVRESVKASEEADAIDTQLNATLARRGEMTNRIKGAIEAYAGQLQKTTRFEDDAAKAAMNRMLQMGAKQADLNRLLTLSADVAIAKNVDLVTAAQAVGAAAAGRTRQLAMLVGADTELAKSAAATLALVQERVGGAAAADIETYTGKVEQAKAAWGNLQEAVGNTITQNEQLRTIMAAVVLEIQRLTEWLSKNGDAAELANLSVRLLGATVASLGFNMGLLVARTGALLQPIYLLAGAAEVAAQAFLMLAAAKRGDLAALTEASVAYVKAKDDLLRLAISGNAVTRAGDAMIASSFRVAGALFDEGKAAGAAANATAAGREKASKVLADGEALLAKYRASGAEAAAKEAEKLAQFALSAGSLSVKLKQAENAMAQLQAAEMAGLLTHAEAAVALEKQGAAVDALRARLSAASALAPAAYKALFATPMVPKPTVPVLEMPQLPPQTITVQTGFSFEQEAQAMAAGLQAEAQGAAQFQETLRQMDTEALVAYRAHLDGMLAATADAQATKEALLAGTDQEIEARAQEHWARLGQIQQQAAGALGFDLAANLMAMLDQWKQYDAMVEDDVMSAGEAIVLKWSQVLGMLGGIMGQIAAGMNVTSKHDFERQKGLQRAAVIMSAGAAIMAAWAGAFSSTPFPPAAAALAAVATALIVAQAALQLSKINSQQFNPPSAKGFAEGTRYVPQTGYALLHEGEKVVPARDAERVSGGRAIAVYAAPQGPVIPASAQAVPWVAHDTERLREVERSSAVVNLREFRESRMEQVTAPAMPSMPQAARFQPAIPPMAPEMDRAVAASRLPVPAGAPLHTGPSDHPALPRFVRPGASSREFSGAGPTSIANVSHTTHKRENNVTHHHHYDFSNSWWDEPSLRLRITDMVDETHKRGYREAAS